MNKKRIKQLLTVCACVVLSLVMATVAFASDVTMSSVSTTMTNEFKTMVGEMMGVVGTMLPIVLPLMGLSILVAFSVRWFKRIAGM